MRRVILFVVFACCVIFAHGQNHRQAYCEVIVWSHNLMLNAAVTFDFGMQTYTTAILYDSNNQPLQFTSGMDAINYLSKRGWKLISVYYESISKRGSVHYIMEKFITDEKQVKDGLNMKLMKLDDFYKMLTPPNSSRNE